MSASLIPASAEPPASPFTAAAQQPQPTLAELFVAFATISLSGFGGVLAWSRRMMVEERKWLTAEQFNETYALCSFLPGGNILNFSVVFGARFGGVSGAIAAMAGLHGPAAHAGSHHRRHLCALRRSAGAAPRAHRRRGGGGRSDGGDTWSRWRGLYSTIAP